MVFSLMVWNPLPSWRLGIPSMTVLENGAGSRIRRLVDPLLRMAFRLFMPIVKTAVDYPAPLQKAQ